jgi:hypothetical protein
MKVGGRRKLVIPPHLGYGDRGAGAPSSPARRLIFVVDLVSCADAYSGVPGAQDRSSQPIDQRR